MKNITYNTNNIQYTREQDNKFEQIQQIINTKRNFLINKEKKINKILKQNQFLNIIKQDYIAYNNYIQQEKNNQVKALQMLNDYLKDLTHTGNLTTHNIEDAKEEQVKILQEINEIKEGLNNVINHIR